MSATGSLPGDDRIIALIAERRRLWTECEGRIRELSEEAFDTLVSETGEASDALDDRIVDIVAASPAGVIAQVQLLASRGKRGEEQPVDDDLTDRLAAPIAAGIRAITVNDHAAGGRARTADESDAALVAAESEMAAKQPAAEPEVIGFGEPDERS
jgi:hypothetical protein